MSRSTFLTTNELPSTNDLRYHHGLMTPNRSNDTLPIPVQSSLATTKTASTSINRNNSITKRNLRDKRRSTGIRPSDISLASTSTEGSTNEDDAEEEKVSTYITDPNESFDVNRTLTTSSPSKPVFTVNRIQSPLENLSVARTDPSIKTSSSNRIFRPEEFRLHRVEKQTSDDDSSTIKYRQLEERILGLESILYEKDNLIHDLQHKLDNMTQDLSDAEEQIYKLHQDKLTLIKAFTTIQDNKSSSEDHPRRSNIVTRN